MNRPAAKTLEFFEPRAGYALYAPVGVVSLDGASELISAAIIFARDQLITRLLVDATGLTGFPNPSVVDRYWIIRQWAAAAKSRVAVAVVLEPHLIDPERFGVAVAANSGMRADVFTSREAALEWLLSSRPCSLKAAPDFNPPTRTGGPAGP